MLKYRKILDKVVSYKSGKPIQELKREKGIENIIKLASNENPLGPSKKVIKAVNDILHDIYRYPYDDCFYVKHFLAQKLCISEENILFGNGSDELIFMAIRSFIEPKDEVIISDPTFMVYKIASFIQEANVVSVPSKNYRYDLDGMLSKINSKQN